MKRGTKRVRPRGVLLTSANDTILRCRINAAFRSQVERRIYAAEGVPEEICPAPCSPPFPIYIRHCSRKILHLCGGEKLVKLGMGVAKKHDHPVLTFVIVPDMALVGYIPVRMPDPVALNYLRRRLH